jgi:hypothetical protein
MKNARNVPPLPSRGAPSMSGVMGNYLLWLLTLNALRATKFQRSTQKDSVIVRPRVVPLTLHNEPCSK